MEIHHLRTQVNFANRASQGLSWVSGIGALVYASAAMLGAVDDATLLCSTAHERARARSPDLEAQNLNVLLPFDPAAMHENCEAIFLSNCAGQFSVAEMQPTLAVSAKNASKGQGGRSSQGNHTVLK